MANGVEDFRDAKIFGRANSYFWRQIFISREFLAIEDEAWMHLDCSFNDGGLNGLALILPSKERGYSTSLRFQGKHTVSLSLRLALSVSLLYV